MQSENSTLPVVFYSSTPKPIVSSTGPYPTSVTPISINSPSIIATEIISSITSISVFDGSWQSTPQSTSKRTTIFYISNNMDITVLAHFTSNYEDTKFAPPCTTTTEITTGIPFITTNTQIVPSSAVTVLYPTTHTPNYPNNPSFTTLPSSGTILHSFAATTEAVSIGMAQLPSYRREYISNYYNLDYTTYCTAKVLTYPFSLYT